MLKERKITERENEQVTLIIETRGYEGLISTLAPKLYRSIMYGMK